MLRLRIVLSVLISLVLVRFGILIRRLCLLVRIVISDCFIIVFCLKMMCVMLDFIFVICFMVCFVFVVIVVRFVLDGVEGDMMFMVYLFFFLCGLIGISWR